VRDVWRDARVRQILREGVTAVTTLALILSLAAFVYLVYAMLKPEQF
jgi:K+-transporting ATPase KdpF subunit